MADKFNYKLTNVDPSRIWFTSDTHFGHANILKFCSRPFDNIQAHDECLISNWNSVVGKDDTVFHLGDFAFAQRAYIREIIPKLNGNIHLVIGNHDFKNMGPEMFKLFKSASQQLYICVNGRAMLLNHYPFLCYAGVYRRDEDLVYQLYGHVHSGPNVTMGLDLPRLKNLFETTQYDVGVDNNNYAPVNFETIDNILKQKQEEYKWLEKHLID